MHPEDRSTPSSPNAFAEEFLNRFEQEVWLRLQKYKLPVIVLLRDTPNHLILAHWAMDRSNRRLGHCRLFSLKSRE